jgi:hypothetical protein
MQIESSWIHVMMLTAALAGCGSTSDQAGPDAAPVLRPGVDDSNQVFKGTPDAHESAFWVAVRDADEAGRAAVVSRLVTDVAADPSNAWSGGSAARSLAHDCALGGCHLRAPGAGGLVLDVTSTAWLAATVGVPALQAPMMDLVAPGDPDRSWLALKISGELCGVSCDSGARLRRADAVRRAAAERRSRDHRGVDRGRCTVSRRRPGDRSPGPAAARAQDMLRAMPVTDDSLRLPRELGWLYLIAPILSAPLLDDGPGPEGSSHGGTRTSMADLTTRLSLLYGGAGRMTTGHGPRGGYHVCLELPFREAG